MTTTITTGPLTDSQVQRKVLDELRWDTRVRETDIGVAVDKGIVTLTGTVETYAEKIAAQQAAHRVTGVLDVANDVRVSPLSSLIRTDANIAEAVRHTLIWDTLVPHEYIQTTVSGGWVTLEGNVPLWSQREDAENAIRNLAGIAGVTNKIAVSPPAVDTAGVRTIIEQALERQATREANHIQVEIRNGTLVLSGQVHSWPEKRAILGAAGHAPGVRQVEDHIRVFPYR